jgi:4-amino-4-deoxy-L-arabinose transferase-like glycosyltransferase
LPAGWQPSAGTGPEAFRNTGRVTAISDTASDATGPAVESEPSSRRLVAPDGLRPATRIERLGLAALLIGTAVAYLWNITVNGMGNNFYAAAAWSGSRSWKALLFGSLDPGNFITVDKPPVSQWVMGLSGRLFGFGSASMLVPEALMGVAAVALLYAAVTRASGSRGAGLIAGAALAATPVAALMFRFNNPDAVMVLLMTAGAYCIVRSCSRASLRWLMLAGVAMGLAFLAKMLEGLMVLPALALTYLVVAPAALRVRIGHLLAAALALVVSSGWYVLLTILWPTGSRPYMAGSTDNSFMDLVVGYNGFARVLGKNRHGESPFELPTGYEMPESLRHGFGGGNNPGATRLFNGEVGFEISWLLPAALLALVLILVERGRAGRTDPIRGAALLFGLWLVIDGVSLSMMKGGMHAYYSLAVAPAVAGLIGLGLWLMWRRRADRLGRLGLAGLVTAAGVWGFVLLARNGGWQPWLRATILALTVVAAVGLLATVVPARLGRAARPVAALAVLGALAGFAGTTAYSVATLPQAHTGGSPYVGPHKPEHAGGLFAAVRAFADGADNPRLNALLRHTHTRWAAAIERSSPAATLELADRTSVMAIGGFTLEDPAPTLAQFQDYVRRHQVRYYLAPRIALPRSWRTSATPAGESGVHRPGPGGWWPGDHRDIADWVAAHYRSMVVGNMTVYDLSQPVH